jgi:peptide/nickel transport system substrate-binding protein
VTIETSRRRFLQGLGAFAGGAAVLGVTSACTSSSSSPTNTTSNQPSGGTAPASPAGGPTGSATVATVSLQGLGQDYLSVLVEPDKTWWNEVFDYPVAQDESGTYIPGLATSWSPSADKLTWSFVIRDGVKFHNGDTLSAEDLAFSYNRLMFSPESKHPLASMAVFVDKISAQGNTLLVKTKQPVSSVPVWFAQSDGSVSGTVVSKAYFDKVGAAKASAFPIGTGPYQFVSSSGQQSVQLTAFVSPDRNAWQKGRTPAVKDVKVMAVTQESTRIALLKTGAADVVPITVADISTVQGAGLQVKTTPSATYAGMLYVGYTLNPNSPFNDVRLREALSIAIDRNAIAKSVYGGTAEPSAAFYGGPNSIGYPKDLQPPQFDPNKAKQLLSAMGFNGNTALQIVTYDDDTDFPGLPTLAEAIAGYYQNVGLNAKVNVMDPDALNTVLYGHKFPGQLSSSTVTPATLYLRGFDNIVNMVPDQISGYTKDGRPGTALWNLPEQQTRLLAAGAEFDAAKQAADLGSYDKWMAANWSQCPLLGASALFGLSKKVASWSPITSKAEVNNLRTLHLNG